MGIENNLTELLSSSDIQKRVKELAQKISEDYAGKELLVVGVLKAAWIFMADIIREVTLPVTCDFMRAVSYKGMSRSEEVNIVWDVTPGMVRGKDVLLVDTVLDSGLTMKSITEHLQVMNPSSLQLCVLVDKPSNRKVSLFPAYSGFTIPGDFIVGYGLDMDDMYRHLPYIAVYHG